MRILLINHYAGSRDMGMEYRPWYLGREWVAVGHEVVIVSASFGHVRQKQPEVDKDFTEQQIDGIRYLWLITPSYSGNGLRRMLNMITFSQKLKKYATRIADTYNPDIVLASSTYTWDNYGARKIARLAGAKYLYEVHDLWPLSPRELGNMPSYHPFIFSLQKAENFAYRHADAVISMLPNTQEHMIHHGLDPGKWNYVPNGIRVDEWSNEQPGKYALAEMLDSLKSEGFFLVGYTGSIGIANALDNFVTSAEILKNEKIRFIIIGDGPEKMQLIQQVKEKNLHNVIFADPVLKNVIPEVLESMDALYIGLQRQPLFRFGISPNKLLDYMIAGRPVIQAIDAGNDMVNEAGCGISIPAEDPEKLAEAIVELTKMTPDQRKLFGLQGREYVIRNHDYRLLAKKMIGIFSDLS